MEFYAPKGMRDFLPQEMMQREQTIQTIKEIYRLYGFVPMDTPALENIETLEKKCGEEIRGQLFRIEDGKLALRFDLTVPLARVAANNSFKKPLKRYCIGPVWRKEEPQKGRFREFYQADADIIGCPSVRAEAELIAVASHALGALGFSNPTVHLNDRRIISAVAKSLLASKETQILRILDKREKIGDEETIRLLEGLGVEKNKAQDLIDQITAKTKNEEKIEIASRYSKAAAQDLESIIELAESYPGSRSIVIDLSLARGLDYYTGPIFEIKLADTIGSVAGGGRYDNLLELYGQGDFAVGISLGIERIMSLSKRLPQANAGVFVAAVDEASYSYAIEVAAAFRAAGIAAQTDLNKRSLAKQLEYASSWCRWAVVVGQKEKEAKKVTLRDLQSGKEETISVKEAIEAARG
ncbi:MAG: histidine--tRNA ligase [Candidatus Micrarchaeota archaeon]|nr:histidine--tRNA ligase [Candidatus Micrarchaeota archaeon]